MAYAEEQIEESFSYIISEIEKGRSLRSVLTDKNTPSAKTFFKWVDSSNEKLQHYTRAQELRADNIFDEMLQIADTPVDGVVKKETEKGLEITTSDMLQHRRLQVDTRKWILSRMNPKKYGDKLETDNTHSGEITIVRKIKK